MIIRFAIWLTHAIDTIKWNCQWYAREIISAVIALLIGMALYSACMGEPVNIDNVPACVELFTQDQIESGDPAFEECIRRP